MIRVLGLLLLCAAASSAAELDAATKAELPCLGPQASAERLAYFLKPFDAERAKLSEDQVTDLLIAGYRVEGGRVLSADTHLPIRRIDYECFKKGTAEAERRDTLERLSLLFDAQNPAKPLSASARKEAGLLLKDHRKDLPPQLAQDLHSASAMAGTLGLETGKAYLGLRRAFDGKLAQGDLAVAAKPLPGPAPQIFSKPYFDDTERKLGAAMQAAVVAQLSKNPVGARVLAQFRDASGVLKLPAFLVLPISDDYAALYDRGRVLFSIDDVAMAAPGAPDEDPKAAAAYLIAHPDGLKAFVEQNDQIIVHELTHAWQHRNDLMWSEVDRGNFPDETYIETEEEAERTAMEYLHEKLKADPDADIDAETFLGYRRFTGDLDGWKDSFDRLYFSSMPRDVATVATGEQLQQEREKAAQSLLKSGPARWALEALKLQGLAQGDQAAKTFSARQDQAWADFRAKDYPRIQSESKSVLARVYLAQARKETDPELLTLYKQRAREYADASGDADLIRQSRELR